MAEEKSQDKVNAERTEDFEDIYANNVRFESSVWDLKVVFGQLDLSDTPPERVRIHTGVTVGWGTAKIMAYFLALNVFLHQSENGPIPIPSRVVPPRPDPANPALANLGPDAVTYMAWIHDQFFGENPHVPPGVDPSKL